VRLLQVDLDGRRGPHEDLQAPLAGLSSPSPPGERAALARPQPLRGALLDARARGACDDDRLAVHKTTDSDGSVIVRLSCAGIPAADVVDRARDAMRWAFDGSRRFGVNLVKIGFKAGDETDVELLSSREH